MGCHYPYSYCQLFPKTLWPAPCAKCKNEGKIKDLIPDQEPSQSAVNSTFETLSYFPLDHDTEIKINIQGAAGGLILQTCGKLNFLNNCLMGGLEDFGFRLVSDQAHALGTRRSTWKRFSTPPTPPPSSSSPPPHRIEEKGN